MIDLIVLENRKLRLKWDGDEDDRHEILDYEDANGSQSALCEILEDYLCNGWSLFDADQLLQLSSAPVLCNDASLEDNGDITLYGQGWYLGSYMVINPIDEILDEGFIDFDFWQDFDNIVIPSE